MKPAWQSTFSQHRQAFADEQAGRLDAAVSQFGAALTGFAAMLCDEEWHTELTRRSEVIVGTGLAAALVGDFLKLWPCWLLDVHFQRTLRGIRSGKLALARAHWQVLLGAEQLAARLEENTVAIYRDRLVQECGIDPGQDLKDETNERRVELLSTAQRILAIDPLIDRARLFAIRVCVREVRRLLDEKRDTAGTRQRGEARLVGNMARTRKRARFRIGRLLRLLARHLRVMARDHRGDPVELVDGYKVLAAYLSLSDSSRALLILRRARRIASDDQEIRDMIRTLRRVGGS